MELALELVNHVPPATADQLLDRLRTAEAALVEAEERLDAARRRASRPSVVGGPCGSFFVAVLSLAVTATLAVALCTTWFDVAGLFRAVPLTCGNAAGWTSPQNDKSVRPWLTDTSDNGLELCISSACALVLEEARADEAALQRSHEELQAGYNQALQAMGSWIQFVRDVAQPNAKRREGSSLRSECIDASHPGRHALRSLLKNIQSPPETSLPTVAEQLEQHLRRIKDANFSQTQARRANPYIRFSFH